MVADFRASKKAEFQQKENQVYDAQQCYSILSKFQEEIISVNSSIVNETQNYLYYPRDGIETLVSRLKSLPEFIDELKSNIRYLEYKGMPVEIIEPIQLQLSKLSCIKIIYCICDFLLSIHHKRTVVCNWFI